MQANGPVVAIDGPSGSGKSTVARAVAQHRGLRYLDTGAMYRAIAWLVLRDGVPTNDPELVLTTARQASLDVDTNPRRPRIAVDGVDVTTAVREADVTAAVSAVSAVPQVRELLVGRQREIIGNGGIVVEGRDIGTTVAPDATVKVFLTADVATRSARRSREDEQAGRQPPAVTSGSGHSASGDLERRDRADSTRAASPLRQAPDALVIDSSSLTVDQVVERVTGALAASLSGRPSDGRSAP